jgi:pimeloyl-ACP methyl ester carboxylesterase
MQALPASQLEPRLDHVQCLSPSGLHRMAYWEWGDQHNPRVLLCVHGLTRTGRDFDQVARRLATRYRVVCPDVVGRGASDWLQHAAGYTIAQYVADMVTLIARIRPAELHWFGTSMGGLIGMAFASLPHAPVSRLVLNDVGPRLDPGALQRIGTYLGQPISFDSFEDGVAYVRQVSQSFGVHSDAQWREFSRFTLREVDGRWGFHYDPDIAVVFRQTTPDMVAVGEIALWTAYDAIGCPTLLVRGSDSDLLSAETAREMTRRGPKARLLEFPDVGHAPSFLHDAQIDLVEAFLLEDDEAAAAAPRVDIA